MRTFRYLSLLGFFGGVGAAVAIGLAISTNPPPNQEPDAAAVVRASPSSAVVQASPSSAVVQAGPSRAVVHASPSSAVVETGPSRVIVKTSPSRAAGAEAPRRAAAPHLAVTDPPRPAKTSSAPVVVAPQGPIMVPPHPAHAQQFPAQIDPKDLSKALELLQREAALGVVQPESVPVPSAEASTPPALQTAAKPPAPRGATPVAKPKVENPPADVARTAKGSPAVKPSKPQAPPETGERSEPMSISQITKSAGEGDDHLTIHLQNEDIRGVLDALSEQGNLNILATKNVSGKITATLKNVDVNTALSAILKSAGLTSKREGKFIFVGTPEEFDTMEQSMDKVGTRVYRPNYVSSADLQALITPMLTEKVGAVSVSAPPEAGIATDTAGTGGGGNKFAGGDVVVVRDYEAVLTQIDQVVAEVDVRPMQVAIEAMILSVQLNDKNAFGVNFQLLRNEPNVKFGLGTPADSLANVTFTDGGLKFAFLDSSLGAFLNALETIGDTNVIANPRVMVINKQKADVHIGDQLGYISTTVTETSSTQSVNFLDVGAQLRLRPFISSDGLVRMEIHPELSTGSVQTTNGITLPNKSVTQVTTNVMIRDGCTVVIGGLMREDLISTINEIPVLGAIPFIGPIFRNTTDSTQKREIIILITPHIVYEPETCQEGERAACEFTRRQAVYAEKMLPTGRRSIARRYIRMAEHAWADGNRDAALRFAELAVHFDPLSRAAIELRSNIWLGRQPGDGLPTGPAPGGPLANPLEGPAVADWLLDDLEHAPLAEAVPLHPLDPGQPGRHQDIVRPRKLQ